MARVLLYTGISMLCVSAALLYLPTCFSFIFIGIIAVLLVGALLLRKRLPIRGLSLLLAITLIFAVFGTGVMQSQVLPAERLAGNRARVVGTVSDWPIRYDDYSVYELKCESVALLNQDGEVLDTSAPQRLTLRLSDIHESDLAVFDRVALEVLFQPLEEQRNSSLANGIYAGGRVECLVAHYGQNRPFYACFYDLRSQISDLIYRNVEYDSAALITAVLLGDRSGLSDDFESDAKAAGVTHTLVVSGMHLGIIFQLLGYLLRFFRISKRGQAVLLLGVIFALSAICGFTPSVLRAGLTYVIFAVGMFFFRRPDGLNSLGFATVIILFTMPFGVGNIAFLLSALATFGLLYICPIFHDRMCRLLSVLHLKNKLTETISLTICQTFAATLATAPVCVLCFGYISLIAPLANLLIGFAITWILVLALCLVVLLCLPFYGKAAATVCILLLFGCCRYVTWIIGRCASVDWAILPTEPILLISWGFVMLAVFLLSYKGFRKSNGRWRWGTRIGILVSLTLAATSFLAFKTAPPKSQVTVLSVGKGCSIVLEVQNEIYLIGAGDTENDVRKVQQYLFNRGEREIDMLVLPSLEKPFCGGAPAVIERLEPDRILCPATGAYAKKLKHICGEEAALFDQKATLELRENGLITVYRDVGAVIETEEAAYVISMGKTLAEFSLSLPQKKVYLICVSQVPSDYMELQPQTILLCGNEELVAEMRGEIKQETVTILDVLRQPQTLG